MSLRTPTARLASGSRRPRRGSPTLTLAHTYMGMRTSCARCSCCLWCSPGRARPSSLSAGLSSDLLVTRSSARAEPEHDEINLSTNQLRHSLFLRCVPALAVLWAAPCLLLLCSQLQFQLTFECSAPCSAPQLGYPRPRDAQARPASRTQARTAAFAWRAAREQPLQREIGMPCSAIACRRAAAVHVLPSAAARRRPQPRAPPSAAARRRLQPRAQPCMSVCGSERWLRMRPPVVARRGAFERMHAPPYQADTRMGLYQACIRAY